MKKAKMNTKNLLKGALLSGLLLVAGLLAFNAISTDEFADNSAVVLTADSSTDNFVLATNDKCGGSKAKESDKADADKAKSSDKADADKAKEGKCGEGKCGDDKAMSGDKAKEGKCGEGKCGDDKAKSGDKAKEAKCGEGKCG